MHLSDLKKGEVCTVAHLNCDGDLKKRLLSFGVTKGEKLTIIGKGPAGSTLDVKLFSGRIALRKDEADKVEVTK